MEDDRDSVGKSRRLLHLLSVRRAIETHEGRRLSRSSRRLLRALSSSPSEQRSKPIKEATLSATHGDSSDISCSPSEEHNMIWTLITLMRTTRNIFLHWLCLYQT
uniref:Uncharacterized protein n=1 Tax=Brassica oleracea var. oleracea TaxID=109376 RepID=A0A0D3DZC3_BRAOL